MLIVIRWESQIYKTPLAASKIKGTHIIVKIGYGRLCLVEDKGNNKITADKLDIYFITTANNFDKFSLQYTMNYSR
jgi:hypothetical protein